MSDLINSNMDQLLYSVPGGIAKLALDDELTIIYATDTFYSLIKNVTDAKMKMPQTLLRNVYSNDIIYFTQQLAVQKHRKDNIISLNFRTLQQDGSFKWVMISGSRTSEVFQSGAKMVPVYSCIAMDVTDHMQKYKKMEMEIDYHRTISELSKELYFEYLIATDTLTFTELFREIFGKDSELKEFSKKLEKSKVVYSEELPGVVKIFKSLLNGKKQVRFEVRLITKEGITIWYVCYASIIFDENRNPFKIIGKLATINPLRKDPEPDKPVLQFDSLTKVLSKDSAESMIVQSIAKQEAGSLSALMLVEVRNYKNLNDIINSYNGENILTTIAGFLMNEARATDIAGRSGLSEFVLYLKDISSDKGAYETAERLCKEVDALYSYEHNKNGLSISIGLAFNKGGQLEYPALTANAKAALVMAKKEAYSSFEVFYGI